MTQECACRLLHHQLSVWTSRGVRVYPVRTGKTHPQPVLLRCVAPNYGDALHSFLQQTQACARPYPPGPRPAVLCPWQVAWERQIDTQETFAVFPCNSCLLFCKWDRERRSKCLSLWGTQVSLKKRSRWKAAKPSFWAQPQALGLSSLEFIHISMQSRPAGLRTPPIPTPHISIPP